MAPKPKILVVGATGLIGAHAARALRGAGFPVRGVRRDDSPTWHLGDVDVEWAQADLDDAESLVAALDGCMGVVHAAGFSPRDGVDVDAARRRGVGQMRNLLDACLARRIPRVVYVSSPATLGAGGEPTGALDEDDMYVPGTVGNAYFEAKWAMEAEIYRYLRRGVPVIVTIPGAVFGPGDVKPTTGELLVRLARGRLPAIIGDRLDVVDVRDVADSLVAALERGRPGRRYVLGGTDTSVDDFVAQVCAIARVDTPRFHLPSAPVRHVARLAERLVRRIGIDAPPMVVGADLAAFSRPLNSDRARAELNHHSRPLHDTLVDALAWFDEHGYLAA